MWLCRQAVSAAFAFAVCLHCTTYTRRCPQHSSNCMLCSIQVRYVDMSNNSLTGTLPSGWSAMEQASLLPHTCEHACHSVNIRSQAWQRANCSKCEQPRVDSVVHAGDSSECTCKCCTRVARALHVPELLPMFFHMGSTCNVCLWFIARCSVTF